MDQAGRQERIGNALQVVIPTLNAARLLPATLASLRDVRTLVVDGGSVDATVAVAERAGVAVLHAARGRGAQLAAGIAATDAPWLLLLHADTVLAPAWLAVAAAHMRQSERAGYFRFNLDSAEPCARRLERAVAWRSSYLGLPYGDQGLLISRRLLLAVGSVRPLPLMEDVDLVRRLRGQLLPLDCNAVTSAARWENDGWTARSARNLGCLALWFAGVPPGVIAKLYR